MYGFLVRLNVQDIKFAHIDPYLNMANQNLCEGKNRLYAYVMRQRRMTLANTISYIILHGRMNFISYLRVREMLESNNGNA